LLREFGTLEGLSRANLTALEACNLPAPAQANYKSKPSGVPKRGARNPANRLPHPELH
jgi:hypothetical protein